ncbi:MAG: efflux RND transporter permease subunit [Pseudomonadota bacterium]
MTQTGKAGVDPRAGPIAWAARHPVIPNLVMLVLLIGGAIGALSMPRALYPDFRVQLILVEVAMPGAGPDAINDGIIRRLEPVIAGIDGVKEIEASTQEGGARLGARLNENADPRAVLIAIQTAIAGVNDLPATAGPPIATLSVRRQPVLSLSVHGPVTDRVLYQAVQLVFADLAAVLPTSTIELDGTTERELIVEVSPPALRAHGLSVDDIARTLEGALALRTGGQMETGRGLLTVDVGAIDLDITALGSLAVGAAASGTEAPPQAERPLLRQLARFRIEGGEDAGRTLFDGNPVVKLLVFQGNEAPDRLSHTVQKVLESTRQRLPPDVAVTLAWDGSEPLVDRMRLIGLNGVIGLGLVLLLLSLFLEIRLAFWVAVGIPTAFFGALMLLPLSGATINLVTLFAFILALGLVVDDAIVAGENIYDYRARGLAPVDAAVAGAQDIATPLSFSVLTNMLAFIPIAMVPGWYGEFWMMVPVVVCLAFLVSWLEALFVLPGHLAAIRDEPRRRKTLPFAALATLQQAMAASVRWVAERVYGPLLSLAMHWRYATVALLIALLAVAFAWPMSGRMGFVLMPPTPSDHVSLRAILPADASLETAEKVRLRMVAAAERVAERHGRAETIKHLESDISDLRPGVLIHLPPAEARSLTAPEFTRAFRAEIGPIAEAVRTTFGGSGGGPSQGEQLRLRLFHNDDAIAQRAASSLASRLRVLDGVEDLKDGSAESFRRLIVDLTATGRALGFTETGIARQIRDATSGRVVARLPDGLGEMTVRILPPDEERLANIDVRRLIVTNAAGAKAPLETVATFTASRSQRVIARQGGARTVSVNARIDDPRRLSTIATTLRETMLPQLMAEYPGLRVEFRGEEAAKQRTLGSFPLSITLTLALMYAALAIPFRSWWQPMIVLGAVPFGAGGAIAGHLLMDKGLSVVSVFGMIALGGVVINAALMMVDYANKAQAAGHGAFEAMRLAGVRRFRPILLTTLTTFGGLAPMIFDTSRSAAFLVPIAISMGFGILFATLALIFLVPCLWMVLDDLRWLANPQPRPLSPERDTSAVSRG